MTAPLLTIQTLYDSLILELTKPFALPQTPGVTRVVAWVFGRAPWRVLSKRLAE